MTHPRLVAGAALVALVLGSARLAAACAVCFGDPSAQMTKGAEQGVWFLLAVMLAVQVGFGIFFMYLRRRSRGFHDPRPKPVFRLVKS